MSNAANFPYIVRDTAMGSASLAPMLPLTLEAANLISAPALVDSGATVNVMPFTLGQQLGFRWEEQTRAISLSGNLARIEARVVTVSGQVGEFAPVRLAFAWTKTDASPLILGQVNFFMEFDVCFSRSRESFEVRPKPTTYIYSSLAHPYIYAPISASNKTILSFILYPLALPLLSFNGIPIQESPNSTICQHHKRASGSSAKATVRCAISWAAKAPTSPK